MPERQPIGRRLRCGGRPRPACQFSCRRDVHVAGNPSASFLAGALRPPARGAERGRPGPLRLRMQPGGRPAGPGDPDRRRCVAPQQASQQNNPELRRGHHPVRVLIASRSGKSPPPAWRLEPRVHGQAALHKARSCARKKHAQQVAGPGEAQNSSHAARRSDKDGSCRRSSSCESRLRLNSCCTKASFPSGAPRTRIPCWGRGKDKAPVQALPPPGTWR